MIVRTELRCAAASRPDETRRPFECYTFMSLATAQQLRSRVTASHTHTCTDTITTRSSSCSSCAARSPHPIHTDTYLRPTIKASWDRYIRETCELKLSCVCYTHGCHWSHMCFFYCHNYTAHTSYTYFPRARFRLSRSSVVRRRS